MSTNRVAIACMIIGIALVFWYQRYASGIHAPARPPTSPVAELARSIKGNGVETARADFEKRLAEVPTYMEQHAAEHQFGKALYQIMGIKGLAWCDPLRLRGCFHELIAEYSEQFGTRDVAGLENYCKAQPTGYAKDNCFHAFGHAFVFAGTGARKTVLEPGLQRCERFTSATSTQNCKEGAFMEFDLSMLSASSSVRVLDVSDDIQTMSPCNDVPPSDKALCVRRRPIWWEVALGSKDSLAKARVMHEWCLRFGSFTSSLYGECISGLALSIFRMNQDRVHSMEFCDAIGSNATDTALCKRKVAEEIARYLEWRSK